MVSLDGHQLTVQNDAFHPGLHPDFNGIQQRKSDGRVAINYFSQKYPAEYWVFDVL